MICTSEMKENFDLFAIATIEAFEPTCSTLPGEFVWNEVRTLPGDVVINLAGVSAEWSTYRVREMLAAVNVFDSLESCWISPGDCCQAADKNIPLKMS